MEYKYIIILCLLVSTIILGILYLKKTPNKSGFTDESKKDLQTLLNQPGNKPSKTERCFIHKAAVSVNKDPNKLSALIGLTCAEQINDAIKTNNFSKLSPICGKYFPFLSKNYKKWANVCAA